MDGDLEHFWLAQKELAIYPDWKRRGRDEFVRLVSPLDIDGVTEEGLRFTMSAHVYTPDRWVTFQIEYASLRNPKGSPLVRFEWRPRTPHNNKGIGPVEHRHKLITATHAHPFDLNWAHSRGQVRKGSLPIAVPIEHKMETYKDALAFVEKYFRINGVKEILEPPWTRREWL